MARGGWRWHAWHEIEAMAPHGASNGDDEPEPAAADAMAARARMSSWAPRGQPEADPR